MKPDIHPPYYVVEATCVCGNVVLTGSTRETLKMDICSGCHPFFTGTQRIIDTEGRVEKFRKRYTQAEAAKKLDKKDKKEKRTAKGQSLAEALAETKPVEPVESVPTQETPVETVTEVPVDSPEEMSVETSDVPAE